MAGDQIVDVDADPKAARRAFWRRVTRVGLPLGGVVLIGVSIIAIVLFAHARNRDGVLQLSADLIENLGQRIQTEVTGYLEPAAAAAIQLGALLPEDGLSPAGRDVIERFAIGLLEASPALASAYVGAPDGDFVMVRRRFDGTLETKIIARDGAAREVVLKRRNAEGQVVAVDTVQDDTFDPRTRPWYRGAASTEGVYWTDVYVFFTDRTPGITASLARKAPDGPVLAVAGVDVRLDALSRFLDTLDVGTSGRALIVDRTGRLVAFPEPDRMIEDAGDGPRPRRLDRLGEPVLTEMYDRFRISREGRSIVEVDGERYVFAASSLARAVGRDWSLLVTVPEEDFVGFVATNSRTALVMSLGVVALAVGMAGMLTYQGFVGERNARALHERELALRAQSAAYEELAATASLFDAGDRDALRRLTEIVAGAVAARRVSLWQAEADASAIVCLACYDRETRGHTSGSEILWEECPGLFEALAAGTEIAVQDARADPRTAGLAALYLEPVGCRSLLSVPINNSRGIAGFVWLEDLATGGRSGVEATTFARVIAHMLGVRFSAAAERAEAAPALAAADSDRRTVAAALPSPGLPRTPRLALRTTSISSERNRALLDRISGREVADDRLRASVFPHTTVLVLAFSDDLALATRASPEERLLVIERIVRALQEISERREIRYVKILNDQIVAAEGFDRDVKPAATAMAEAALELQEACAASFERLAPRLDYAIGLDTGTAIGSAVGFGDVAYNLWGEAVRVGATMAQTARAGTIQVTEATYEQLRDRFLFRRRGGYYLEKVGEMTTYVLRGRL